MGGYTLGFWVRGGEVYIDRFNAEETEKAKPKTTPWVLGATTTAAAQKANVKIYGSAVLSTHTPSTPCI